MSFKTYYIVIKKDELLMINEPLGTYESEKETQERMIRFYGYPLKTTYDHIHKYGIMHYQNFKLFYKKVYEYSK